MTVALVPSTAGGRLVRIEKSGGEPISDIAERLESAFTQIRSRWEETAKNLPASDLNDRGHFGTCAPNVSDHGLMLAWGRLVEMMQLEAEAYAVFCADPWLYRHLASIPGVRSEPPPRLGMARIRLKIRGLLARSSVTFSMVRACLSMRAQRLPPSGGPWLVVYGHPSSDANGRDGYFGDLMLSMPQLHRILHVDCAPGRAKELCEDGRTISLHGLGNPLYALSLCLRRWRLPASAVAGPDTWLIRRALETDNGFAGAAMIAWQVHCQRRWLAQHKPERVFWPWENHGWERTFCRDLRRAGIRSFGYQHSVVGDQWNLGPASNPDGAASLPDTIICNGDSGRRQLSGAGHSAERLTVGGTLRSLSPAMIPWESQAPVFVALPFDLEVAHQMVDACRQIAGRRFVVRKHPMTPLDFTATGNIAHADGPLSEQKVVAAVIYAATTVGLEAWMAGLPTIRFRPDGYIAIDILPNDVEVRAATAATLGDVLENAIDGGAETARDDGIFSPVDTRIWTSYADPDHSPCTLPEREETLP